MWAVRAAWFSSPDGTFNLVYASHILEHTAWIRPAEILTEWVRVLKPGGVLEIWVPDGLRIAEAFVGAERLEPVISNEMDGGASTRNMILAGGWLAGFSRMEMAPAQRVISIGTSRCSPSAISAISCKRLD